MATEKLTNSDDVKSDFKTNRRRGFKSKKASKFSKFTENRTDSKGRNYGTKTNEFRWYNHNPVLVRNSANISWGNPAGTTQPAASRNGTYNPGGPITGVTSANILSNFGIYVLEMTPSTGCFIDSASAPKTADPINVASKAIYTFVRHMNSGHSNYESSDLMMYLLAMREVYAFSGFITRLYGLIRHVNPMNRFSQRAFVKAAGGDYDDLITHIADLRYFINYFNKRASSLAAPKSLPLFEKAFWMFAQLYQEDDTGKGQVYCYRPRTFMKFDPTSFSNGSALVPVDAVFSTANPIRLGYNFAQIVVVGNALLDALLSDEDIGIMSGDVRKAYGSGNLFSLGDIPDDYLIAPVYDEKVLWQFHNARIFGSNNVAPIIQLAGDQIAQWHLWYASSASPISFGDVMSDFKLIDVNTPDPSEEDAIESTQYTNHVLNRVWVTGQTDRWNAYLDELAPFAGSTWTGITWFLTAVNTSDYIPSGQVVYWFDYQNTLQEVADSPCVNGAQYAFTPCFEWLPLIVYTDSNPYPGTRVKGQLHNYTSVSYQTLANMHDTSLISLLAVPPQGQ